MDHGQKMAQRLDDIHAQSAKRGTAPLVQQTDYASDF